MANRLILCIFQLQASGYEIVTSKLKLQAAKYLLLLSYSKRECCLVTLRLVGGMLRCGGRMKL